MARGPFRLGSALTGDKALLKELKRLEKAGPGAMARALYQQGVAVSAEAVRRAPVQFGVLRSSGYVAPPTEGARGRAVVEVGFGTVYAARQHEEEGWNHPRGGEAKYLEKALAAEVRLERIAAWARHNLANGLGTDTLPAGPPTSPRVGRRKRRRAERKRRKAAARKKARTARRKEKRRRRRKKR